MKKSWLVEIRGRTPPAAAFLLGLAPIAVIVLLWWWFTRGAIEERAIAPAILPSPREVVSSLPSLFSDRDLAHHVWISLRRVALSYLVALAVVLPLGVLMGSFQAVRATFAPSTTASGYIPIATLVPLTMSWFGIGELQKIVFLALAFGIYLLPLVVRAIDAVPDVYLRTARTLGATRRQIVFRVLVPIALPDIWHALRLSFGVGWTYLVLAEVVVLADGLGFLIEVSRRRGPKEHIYLVIVVITVIAWVADLLWQKAGDRLFRYRRTAT